MSLFIDHVILAVPNLDEAMLGYEMAGFTANFGGVHASGTTHNALVVFADGTYLELMALTGQPLDPHNSAADYSHLVRGRQGVAGFALGTHNLSQLVEDLRGRGVRVNDPVSGSRLRTDGLRLAWRIANLQEHESPFFLEDVTDRKLRVPDSAVITTHANGASGIAGLRLAASEPDKVAAFYQVLVDAAAIKEGSLHRFDLNGVELTIGPASSATPDVTVTLKGAEDKLIHLMGATIQLTAAPDS